LPIKKQSPTCGLAYWSSRYFRRAGSSASGCGRERSTTRSRASSHLPAPHSLVVFAACTHRHKRKNSYSIKIVELNSTKPVVEHRQYTVKQIFGQSYFTNQIKNQLRPKILPRPYSLAKRIRGDEYHPVCHERNILRSRA